MLQDAVRMAAKDRYGIDVGPDLAVRVESLEHEGDLRVVSDLRMRLGIDRNREHAISGDALFAVANLDQRLEVMRSLDGVTGFRRREASLFGRRLAVDSYGVLFDEDRWRRFVLERPESAGTAFLVTHSPTAFAGIATELPTDMTVIRLPDSYLSMFLPERGRA